MHRAIQVLSDSTILGYDSSFCRPLMALRPTRTTFDRIGMGHDSWVAARDGRDWPAPPRRDNEGRYVRDA